MSEPTEPIDFDANSWKYREISRNTMQYRMGAVSLLVRPYISTQHSIEHHVTIQQQQQQQ
jgi:hypothetical protein